MSANLKGGDMKRFVFLLLATSLISNTFAQQSRTPAEESVLPTSLHGLQIMSADEDQFLFYQPPPKFRRSGVQQIDFVLHRRAEVYLVERLRLELRAEPPNAAVQFLSREPARLREILRLAQDSNHLGLAVRVDGKLIRDFSFNDFLAYSRALKNEPGFSPAHVDSKLLLLKWKGTEGQPSTVHIEDFTCLQECDFAYEDCAQQACGDPQSICGECLDQWMACRDACPPPPPPPCSPTTTYRTETYRLSCSLIFGPVCMPGIYGGFTLQYYVSCNFVTYTFAHTVNCDGTVSDTVTNANYFSLSDYLDSGNPC
jgi:hypothetical protein